MENDKEVELLIFIDGKSIEEEVVAAIAQHDLSNPVHILRYTKGTLLTFDDVQKKYKGILSSSEQTVVFLSLFDIEGVEDSIEMYENPKAFLNCYKLEFGYLSVWNRKDSYLSFVIEMTCRLPEDIRSRRLCTMIETEKWDNLFTDEEWISENESIVSDVRKNSVVLSGIAFMRVQDDSIHFNKVHDALHIVHPDIVCSVVQTSVKNWCTSEKYNYYILLREKHEWIFTKIINDIFNYTVDSSAGRGRRGKCYTPDGGLWQHGSLFSELSFDDVTTGTDNLRVYHEIVMRIEWDNANERLYNAIERKNVPTIDYTGDSTKTARILSSYTQNVHDTSKKIHGFAFIYMPNVDSPDDVNIMHAALRVEHKDVIYTIVYYTKKHSSYSTRNRRSGYETHEFSLRVHVDDYKYILRVASYVFGIHHKSCAITTFNTSSSHLHRWLQVDGTSSLSYKDIVYDESRKDDFHYFTRLSEDEHKERIMKYHDDVMKEVLTQSSQV